MELDLPYKVEYCPPKVDVDDVEECCMECEKKFNEGSLRIAQMVQVSIK